MSTRSSSTYISEQSVASAGPADEQAAQDSLDAAACPDAQADEPAATPSDPVTVAQYTLASSECSEEQSCGNDVSEQPTETDTGPVSVQQAKAAPQRPGPRHRLHSSSVSASRIQPCSTRSSRASKEGPVPKETVPCVVIAFEHESRAVTPSWPRRQTQSSDRHSTHSPQQDATRRASASPTARKSTSPVSAARPRRPRTSLGDRGESRLLDRMGVCRATQYTLARARAAAEGETATQNSGVNTAHPAPEQQPHGRLRPHTATLAGLSAISAHACALSGWQPITSTEAHRPSSSYAMHRPGKHAPASKSVLKTLDVIALPTEDTPTQAPAYSQHTIQSQHPPQLGHLSSRSFSQPSAAAKAFSVWATEETRQAGHRRNMREHYEASHLRSLLQLPPDCPRAVADVLLDLPFGQYL